MKSQRGSAVVWIIVILVVIVIAGAAYWYWSQDIPQQAAQVSGTGTDAATTTKQNSATQSEISTEQTQPIVPSNAVLAETGNQYDLYILINGNAASTTGQYFLLNNTSGQRILLGASFDATKSEITDFLAASVTALILSENGKYVAFDQGTSIERGWSVFSIGTGNQVATFCGVHQPLFWDNAAIYLACDESSLNTAFEAGVPDIEAANLLTGATTTLAASNVSGSYFFYTLGTVTANELSYTSTPLYESSNGTWDLSTSSPASMSIDLAQQLGSW